MAAFNYAAFATMLQDKKPLEQSINLSGRNIDYCMGMYLMQKKKLSKSDRLRINNIRRRIRAISEDIPTNMFCTDFNEQLYYCWHEVEFEGETLNYNSINAYVSTLRSILKWSRERGAEVTASYDEFPREKEGSYALALSRHEISHMYTFPLETIDKRKDRIETLTRVRDQFVLNCITYGLRYSDLSRLSEGNFAGNVLRIKQKKTQSILTNDLSMSFLRQIQREILAKYGCRDAIYTGDINNYNKALKEIGSYLGGTFDEGIIVREQMVDGVMVTTKKKKWQKLSSHVARHSFISILLAENNPVTKVQRAVGHASIKQTGEYAVPIED